MHLHWYLQVALIPLIVDSAEESTGNLEDHMNSLIQTIIDKYMNSFNCIILVAEDGALVAPTPYFSNSMVFIDSKQIDELMLQIFSKKCQGWILQLRDALGFMKKLEGAREQSLIRFIPRILFLPWDKSKYAKALFQSPELDYISDAVAAEIKGTGGDMQLELLANNFYANVGSKQDEIHLGFWPLNNSIDLYPDKIKDLHGKELRVATLQYLPYSQISPDLDGVEIRILQAFCKHSNCSITAVTDDYQWGEIWENGSSNGIVGNVFQDKADVGCGAVYLWYYDHIEFSNPYMPSRVTLLLPKPSQMPEWRVPLAPFDLALWIALVISIALVAFVLFNMNYFLERFNYHHSAPSEFQSGSGVILRAVGMAVGQSPQNAFTTSSSLRIVFTTFEFLFLLYGTIYCGALASVVTVPAYYPPIDSLRQFHASSLPWAADHIAWVKNLMEADDPFVQDLLEKFEIHDQDVLSQLANKGGYGFTIELTHGGHVSEAAFLSADMINNLHVMKEALYYTYSTTVMRKGSPYADALNKLILKCTDTGLLQLWESEMISKYGSSIIQTSFKLSKSSKTSNEPHILVKLKLKHTQGAFILLILGNAVGTMVFLLEYYYKSLKPGIKRQ